MARSRARARRGKRVVVMRPGKRFKRLNVIAGQCGDQVIAQYTYDWTTNSAWFEVWFQWHLCPQLRAHSIIIMDNARFHRKIQLEKIASFYGYRILWLPPYSPDKNPIEHLWANLKNWLRMHSHNFPSIQLAITAYFQQE